ncbi:hypothetical protein Sango_0215100 [Sesamum angolense]|uniref:PLAC8 family protein n=1 Tax=Sesamum angolense TaxID=2727404 RepID=A0AAE1XH83_9LAMI|nr:hypothetical protein Sango_0215100 [Sesamum angolense]
MVGKEKLEKMEARRSFRNLWHASLMRTPIDDPTYCCFALWCGPCASYLLRKRALRDDMSRYECCGGYMPCSGKCGESKCPELCLCSEGTMVCFQSLACIFALLAMITGIDEVEDMAQLLDCIADMIACVVCPCMQVSGIP